jgi:hypothetical protein
MQIIVVLCFCGIFVMQMNGASQGTIICVTTAGKIRELLISVKRISLGKTEYLNAIIT